MSGEKDTAAPPRETGPAERSYSSLLGARGGTRQERPVDGAVVVSIQPMDERSYWRHVGGGKWNAAGAVYQQIAQVRCTDEKETGSVNGGITK